MDTPALPARSRANRYPGPCHRCNAHVRVGAGILAPHPFAPRRSIVVCARCEPRPVAGGHDGPAKPAISPAAAMMAANAYAHAFRTGDGPVTALGEIARLCAWASGDAIVASMVAATDAANVVPAVVDDDDDEWIAPASVQRELGSPSAAQRAMGLAADDLVADILGKSTVPTDANRIADTLAGDTPIDLPADDYRTVRGVGRACVDGNEIRTSDGRMIAHRRNDGSWRTLLGLGGAEASATMAAFAELRWHGLPKPDDETVAKAKARGTARKPAWSKR